MNVHRFSEMKEVFPSTGGLRAIAKETSANEPILMLLPSDGCGAYDMTSELAELANETLDADSYTEIAMGADQTEAALNLVESAVVNGCWICLKNVHLVSHWLPTLERTVDQLLTDSDSEATSRFRLWMTAEPLSTLPLTLLQRCKKIVSEVKFCSLK